MGAIDALLLQAKLAWDGSEAEQGMGDASDSAKKMESGMSKTLKKVATGLAAAFTVDKIVSFGKECIASGAEVSAENAAFSQIMGEYATEAAEKMGAIAEATGMVDTRLTPYMTSMTAKFKGLGYGVEDATTMASRGLTIAADASAFWDMSLDESMSHLNSFINGSYEGGEAIGLFANDTQMAAYAIEKGIVADTTAWSNLDEATKQATRLEYAENMMAQSGATGQAAKESGAYANVMANLAEKWRQFQALIGEPLIENVVIPAVNLLTKGINFLTKAVEYVKDHFKEWKPYIEGAAYALGILGAAVAGFKIGSMISGIAAFAKGLNLAAIKAKVMAAAQKVLNIVMSANPVGLVIAAIAALAAGLVVAYKKSETFRNFVNKLWASIKNFLQPAFEAVSSFITSTVAPAFQSISKALQNLLTEIRPLIEIIKAVFVTRFNQIKITLSTIWDSIKIIVTASLHIIKTAITTAFNNVKIIVRTIWNHIKIVISTALSVIEGIIKTVTAIIRGDWAGAWTAIKGIFIAIWEGIKAALGNILDGLKSYILNTLSGIRAIFSIAWNAIKNVTLRVWEGIKASVSNAINGAKQIVGIAVRAIKERMNFSGLVSKVSSVWEGIKSAITGAINAAKTGLFIAWTMIKATAIAVWEGLKATASSVWEGIKSAITGAINAAKTGLIFAWTVIKATAIAVWEGIKATASSVWEGVKNAITGPINAAKTRLSIAWTLIKSKASSVWNGIKDTATTVWEGIKSAIADPIGTAKDLISTAVDSIKGFLSFSGLSATVAGVWNKIKSNIIGKITTAKNTISSIIDKIKGFFDFEFSWPSIPMPHFSISPDGWTVGDLLKGSIPSLGIEWYSKAMDKAAVLDGATIFGAAGGQLLGGGETGREVVSGEAHLIGLINQAVAQNNAALLAVLREILAAIRATSEELYDTIVDALTDGVRFKLNDREFGRLVRAHA